jgi:hypothetical protein
LVPEKGSSLLYILYNLSISFAYSYLRLSPYLQHICMIFHKEDTTSSQLRLAVCYGACVCVPSSDMADISGGKFPAVRVQQFDESILTYCHYEEGWIGHIACQMRVE